MSVDQDTATKQSAAVAEIPVADPKQAHAGRDYTVRMAPTPTQISKPAGFVDKGSLVSFVAGVSTQNQADVLNSTLLAQLAADKQHDRETAIMDWYKYYSQVLGQIGWVLEGYNFSKYSTTATSFSMDKAVLEIAAAALTGDEAAVVAATIDALGKLPESDGRLQLFNHTATNGTEGNFQISVCTETDGAVAMKNMAFYYTSAESSTSVLFFNFSTSNSSLNQSVQGQTLNADVYATVRSAVVQKLGANAKNFVLNLDI